MAALLSSFSVMEIWQEKANGVVYFYGVCRNCGRSSADYDLEMDAQLWAQRHELECLGAER